MQKITCLKVNTSRAISVLVCLALVLGELVLFPMNTKAETIACGDNLLDVSIGEEFIIEDGQGEIRQFPFLEAFDNDVFVSFSQHEDGYFVNPVDGLRVSRDGGVTWNEYSEGPNTYFTSMVKRSSGELIAISYISYFIDSRHGTVGYSTSNDNGLSWTSHTGVVEFPQDVVVLDDATNWSSMLFHRTMMEMEDGSLQGLMYGRYAGDTDFRSIWVKSTDGGASWSVVSNVAVPSGVEGEPTTFCEPVAARCSDGSILCVMRVGNKPLYQCRSTDNGLTWSKPIQIPNVTDTDAYSVDADLCLMSNGVLALSYGRPHCKILLSADGTGEKWEYLNLTKTESSENQTSGYTGVREVAPNKLLVIGDTGANWQSPTGSAIWGKFVEVRKTPVALEDGVDAGVVDINGTTYTAKPYTGNDFLGWYDTEGNLVSQNATESFADGSGPYIAKMQNNSQFASPGFEYADIGLTSTFDPAEAVYPKWYASSSWAHVDVVSSESSSGSKALQFFAHYRPDTYTDITGLRPNTTYTVSYKWMMRESYTNENSNRFYGMVVSATDQTTASAAYSNRLGGDYGSYDAVGKVWQEHTFRFNTGDLTTVRLFVEYSSSPNDVSNLFIDDLTVVRDPEPLSVSLESGTDAGYITNEGNTYTAVPYDGNKFLGWYNDNGLVSKNLTETFGDTDGEITAKFKNNSLFNSPGYELEALGDTVYHEHSTVNSGWHIGTSWGKALVVSGVAHSGNQSLALMSRYQTDVYTNVTNLEPNTDYTVSYYWMMQQGYDDTNKSIHYGMIASSTDYETSGAAWGNKLGHDYGAKYPEAGVWYRSTFKFNTGDLTTVRLFLDYESASTSGYLYVDELTVYKTPEPLSVNLESGTDAGYITNEGNTYTAVPYDGNKFLGWYNDNGLVSKNLTETFGDTDGEITAKFKNNSLFNSPGFELEALGDTVYHEHSTINSGWHIATSWGTARIVSGVAHSGNQSLALMSRYQTDVYTNVTGLKPDTDYTVSFYWMMQEGNNTTNKNICYGMIAANTECLTSGEAWGQNLGHDYGAKYPEAGVWNRSTFKFNTGDLTTVRLFLDYESAVGTGYLYIDELTVFEVSENLYDYDADNDPNKFVNRGGAATITEVNIPESSPELLGEKVYELKTSADFAIGYAADSMLLKKDKQYELSLYLRVAEGHTMLTSDDAGQYITFIMKTTDDSSVLPLQAPFTLTIEPMGGKKVIFNSQSDEFSIDKNHVVDSSGAPTWVRVTASFTPAEDTVSTLAVRPNAAGTVYMDKVVVASAENAAEEITAALTTVGTAIRTEGVQALRFKSCISKAAIDRQYFGLYELVEYGSVAIKTEYLGGKELVFGSYDVNGGTTNSFKGAAYIKGDRNIIFSETEDEIIFTAALINIKQADYNTPYSVRTYAVLQRPDGSTFTIYDDQTQSASVYGIACLAYEAEGDNDGYAETAATRQYLLEKIISKADFTTFPEDGFKK